MNRCLHDPHKVEIDIKSNKKMNKDNNKNRIRSASRMIWLSFVAFLFATSSAFATNTNAFDTGLNYYPTPNAMSGNNKGFGFGAWVMTGNSYIDNTTGQHPHAFAIWNSTANTTGANGISSAKRTFNTALQVGGTFSCDLLVSSLANGFTNGFQLQDASGKKSAEFSVDQRHRMVSGENVTVKMNRKVACILPD